MVEAVTTIVTVTMSLVLSKPMVQVTVLVPPHMVLVVVVRMLFRLTPLGNTSVMTIFVSENGPRLVITSV